MTILSLPAIPIYRRAFASAAAKQTPQTGAIGGRRAFVAGTAVKNGCLTATAPCLNQSLLAPRLFHCRVIHRRYRRRCRRQGRTGRAENLAKPPGIPGEKLTFPAYLWPCDFIIISPDGLSMIATKVGANRDEELAMNRTPSCAVDPSMIVAGSVSGAFPPPTVAAGTAVPSSPAPLEHRPSPRAVPPVPRISARRRLRAPARLKR
jgi:hypothetical protein